MKVYSETVVWSAPPEFAAEAPYQLVMVDLDEGGRRMGRVMGDRVEIGDPLVFVEARDGVSFYRKTK